MTPDGRLRLVLDTNVLVAAFRSRTGASSALLDLAQGGRCRMLVSTTLLLEYEAVLTRSEHLRVSDASLAATRTLLDLIADLADRVEPYYRWRPQLADPNDEMVLEAAVNGRADAIVTFNTSHLRAADRFGIRITTPSSMLRWIHDDRAS